MTEIRCAKCNKLLMKANVVIAEIKCPKCGYVDKIGDADFKPMIKNKANTVSWSFLVPFGSKIEKYLSEGSIKIVNVSISI